MIGAAVGAANNREPRPVEALSGNLGAKVTPENFAANKTVIMVTSDVNKYVKALTTGSNGWLSTDGGTEANAMEFTLGGAATAASLKTDANKYVNFTGNKNVSLSDNAVTPFYLNASGDVCISNNTNTLKHNDSSKGFRVYTDKSSWKSANLYYVSSGVEATINGSNSVNAGAQWSPTSITENESGNEVSNEGLTYSFAASDGAVIASSNASTGTFTASAAGTVTVSAEKEGYSIADKVVTITSLDPFINLTLTSAQNSYTGQNVNITAEYGNGVTGLSWTVESGTVTNITSSDTEFSGKIGGDTGTLTIRATDTGSETYSEVSINVTKVVLTLDAKSIYLDKGASQTIKASHNADAYGNVIWSSNNDKITVENGVVTAAADATFGLTATITATSSVDQSVSDTCDVTIALCSSIALNKNTAVTVASADELVFEAQNEFTLRVDKHNATTPANNYYGGDTNKRTSTRFYKDSKVSIIPDIKYVAVRAVFKATSNSYANNLKNSTFENATAEVSNDIVTITFVDGTKPLVATIKDTCGFESVKLYLLEKTAKQEVESVKTQSALAYHYEGDTENGYEFSNIVMRFGGKVSKELWNKLDTDEHKITGFGVMIADGSLVETFADFKSIMGDAVSSTVSEDLSENVAIDYFVPVADMASKIGEDANNYFWNLRVSVDESKMNTMYSAIAYIKLGDEYVLMDMARESVKTIAADYLNNRGYDKSAAAGSLQFIVQYA